jgi:hypothetical protein
VLHGVAIRQTVTPATPEHDLPFDRGRPRLVPQMMLRMPPAEVTDAIQSPIPCPECQHPLRLVAAIRAPKMPPGMQRPGLTFVHQCPLHGLFYEVVGQPLRGGGHTRSSVHSKRAGGTLAKS